MITNYAPAERETIEKVKEDYNLIRNIEYIEHLINSLPYYGAILNDKRQIVFANEKLLDTIGLTSIENILGLRPGETLNCINAGKFIGGCGTSNNCSVCGAVNCILESQRKNQMVVSECRINATHNGHAKSYEFKVTSTPFTWNNHRFYVLSMVDISDEKRRKALEKIFFHDVINKTGSMNGFIDLMKIEKDPEQIKEMVNMLDLINHDLIEEIQTQRDLLSAENSELKTKFEDVDSKNLIEFVVNEMSRHDSSKEKEIIIEPEPQSLIVKTDKILIKRILTNMLKNALEASVPGEKVWIGCSKTEDYCRFWVRNKSVMPEDLKLQVFQRSFSTKGINRGLGTYSMKLLGEKYLKGKVDFKSTDSEGTVFFIDLPQQLSLTA
jgi:signal transduction histidine kinase